jgi:hypothetical protein
MEEYYRKNYVDYERQNSRRKLDFYLALVRRWVPRGSRLFELGVGAGHFLERASTEYVCSGSDVNLFGVTESRRRVPHADLHEGSFERIPTSPAPTVVVAWGVLEHVPDLDRALGYIRSRLPEPGFLIAVVPVYDGPLGWLVRRLDHDPTHVWKLGRREWIRILHRHGFEIVDSGGSSGGCSLSAGTCM